MLLITMKRGSDVAGVDKHETATYENFLAHGWVEIDENEEETKNEEVIPQEVSDEAPEEPQPVVEEKTQEEKPVSPRGRRAR